MGSSRRAVHGTRLAAVLAALLPMLVVAQSATPTPAPAGVELVASGLAYPRGMAWDAAGTLHVALAGDAPTPSTTNASAGSTGVEHAFGVFYAGSNGTVATIRDGCGAAYATGLPTALQAIGWNQGVSSLAFLDGTLYASVDGGGAARGDAAAPSGVYLIDSNGGWAAVASLDAWMPSHPVAIVPGDLDPDGEPYGLIADGATLVLSESNSGQLLRVAPNGTITRIADLSTPRHEVPTGLAKDAAGNFYLGNLGVAPYADGSSVVRKVTPDGQVSVVWTGLTAVTDIAVEPDGTLYALEMSTGNDAKPPFFQRHTGRIVRQTGPDSSAEVATGLDQPVALDLGPDGWLYVSLPATGGADAKGGIVRIDPKAAPVAVPPDILEGRACAPVGLGTEAGEPITGPPAATGGTPVAVPAAPSAPAAVGGSSVAIKDYAFNPPTLTVKAGTTVTWTNDDQVPHTATAADGSFDSGNLNPGQTFSHTFGSPGTFDYVCSYHAGMKGTVVVEP